MLIARDIAKTYGAHSVLTCCSFSVAAGECVVIRGRSGGGKSTLLRILTLLEPADRGVVVHGGATYPQPIVQNGYPGSSYPFATLVFQQLFLWPHLTVRQNVAIVLHGAPRAALGERAHAMFQRLAISEVLDRKPHECSLGQRQRAAVGRALLTPASFILLDEPTSALDRANRSLVVDALREAKQAGRGLVIVSHDERDFRGICDATLELDQGVLQPIAT